MPLQIRTARPGDAALVVQFIRDLADYERLKVKISESDVEALLFSKHPRAFCEFAFLDGEPSGFALWFYIVSTFEGRGAIHLEDIFVRPAARGRGVGRALMAQLARRCVAENLCRVQWDVLDWNAPAIAFYDSLGAEKASGWHQRRLSPPAIATLAEPD
ncbi:MAG: GNAT family N-acetyltransferase [Caulobacteraceae bacterium]